MAEPIHVAVGVIIDAHDRVLIAKRPVDVHQGNLWEFPGGKVEKGESVLAALRRELREELGITIDTASCIPVKKIYHRYGERAVLLDTWRVSRFVGTPEGLEKQPLAWCPIEELSSHNFPAANQAIINLLQLPPVIAITGGCTDRRDFLRRFENLLHNGLRLVQFRQPQLSDELTRQWLKEALKLCEGSGARIVFNGPPEVIKRIVVDGYHVNSAKLMALRDRPVPTSILFSASCHDAEELFQAERLGVDFALLSPVKATLSHPGSDIMGWEGFQKLVSQVSFPVYALGGLSTSDLRAARQAGAFGIAAINAFWHPA